LNKSLRVAFSVCIPSYERREWKIGEEMPSPPAAPGVYVFEAWEERDERARKEFEVQCEGGMTDPATEPLEVFIDPADGGERSGFGVLAYRYVGQGKSLAERLSAYVRAGKGPITLQGLTPDELRGIPSAVRVVGQLNDWLDFADARAPLEETAGPSLSDYPRTVCGCCWSWWRRRYQSRAQASWMSPR